MKKVYQKPGMYVENFSLSQSIAFDCGADHNSSLGKPGYADKDHCGWDVGNAIIWNIGSQNCDFPGGDFYEGVCYNNPNGNNVIFNS